MKQRVGLITWHYYPNFGSALQAYALQTVIATEGYSVEIINYRNPIYDRPSVKNYLRIVASKIGSFLGTKVKERYAYSFLNFQMSYLKQSAYSSHSDEINKQCSKYYSIVCGSDQIWAPNVFNPVYMINFADGKKIRKISYAPSIGLNDLPDNLVSKYKELLSDFQSISVREESGKELLKEKCGINSTVVLDPTLLLNANEYQLLQKKVDIPDNFVFCYFLNADHEYKRTVQEYAKKNNCRIIGWSAKVSDSDWMTLMQWIGPCELLWLIEHAKCIFTDSYHGTILSLLFHKVFWTFERFKADDPICQNSRIYQLDKYFEIGNRIIKSDSMLSDHQPVNYESFEQKLKELRKKSLRYLKEALE
jgi:hypothetical protein